MTAQNGSKMYLLTKNSAELMNGFCVKKKEIKRGEDMVIDLQVQLLEAKVTTLPKYNMYFIVSVCEPSRFNRYSNEIETM